MAPAEKKERKRGRKPVEVTDERRALVAANREKGPTAVAALLGISVPTLRKYFAAEMAEPAAADLFSTVPAAPPQPPRARKPRGRNGGRPAFEPRDHHRAEVISLAAADVPKTLIAERLRISVPTLEKHFAAELADALPRRRAELVARLEALSRAGDRAATLALLKMTEEAELVRLQAKLGDKPAAPAASARPPREEAPGVKVQRLLAADDALKTGDWAFLADESAAN